MPIISTLLPTIASHPQLAPAAVVDGLSELYQWNTNRIDAAVKQLIGTPPARRVLYLSNFGAQETRLPTESAGGTLNPGYAAMNGLIAPNASKTCVDSIVSKLKQVGIPRLALTVVNIETGSSAISDWLYNNASSSVVRRAVPAMVGAALTGATPSDVKNRNGLFTVIGQYTQGIVQDFCNETLGTLQTFGPVALSFGDLYGGAGEWVCTSGFGAPVCPMPTPKSFAIALQAYLGPQAGPSQILGLVGHEKWCALLLMVDAMRSLAGGDYDQYPILATAMHSSGLSAAQVEVFYKHAARTVGPRAVIPLWSGDAGNQAANACEAIGRAWSSLPAFGRSPTPVDFAATTLRSVDLATTRDQFEAMT